MMLTRCPACQTVFRLRPEQVQQCNGEVRCGHCFDPFNALDNLIEAPPSPLPMQTTTPPASPQQADSFSWLSDTAPSHAKESELSFPPLNVETPAETDTIAANDGTQKDSSLLKPEQCPEPEPTVDILLSTTEAASPTVLLTQDETPPDATPPSIDNGNTLSLSPASNFISTTEITKETHLIPDLERLDELYGSAKPLSFGKRALWTLITTLLLCTLSAQLIYLFRNEIARDLPGLRPIFSHLCRHIGCTVTLPHQAALLTIETSDLQAEPGKPGRYILYATIKNKANYTQAWPHLELTLTDVHNTPIARRVLSPKIWVNQNKIASGFSGRSDAAVRILFNSLDLEPSNYRIYVFYP